MTRQFDQLLKGCTVRITSGKEMGTGFFVAPGLILTCAHVVEPTSSRGRAVEVAWRDSVGVGRVAPERYDRQLDLALVETDLRGHPCVLIGEDLRLKDNLHLFGYTAKYLAGEPEIVEFVGWQGDDELIKLSRGQILQGFSGAPLLNLRTGHVCGIVRRSRDVVTDLGGRGIAASAILQRFPELVQLQEEFHRSDRRWAELPAPSASAGAPLRLPPLKLSKLDPAPEFTGRMPYLRLLEKFWEGEQRVVALVGVGGTGKTAIVRQFLDNQGWIAGGSPEGGPDGLVIRSFYDTRDVEDFVQKAFAYFSRLLESEPPAPDDKVSAHALAELLRTSPGRKLLVLDGIETLQSSGGMVARGALDDGAALRNLLIDTADGRCGDTKAIITSRFSVTDLHNWPRRVFQEHTIDDLTESEARKLLRRLGVVTDRLRLKPLLEEYGRGMPRKYHALTMDLLGHYIHTYQRGDPLRVVGIKPLEEIPGDGDLAKKQRKLNDLLRAYEEALRPAQNALMQLLSVFPFPVGFEFLVQSIGAVRGHSLRSSFKTTRDVQTRLHELVQLRLVTEIESDTSEKYYTLHPVIRDYFYSRLVDPARIHEAVGSLLDTLTDKPRFVRPKDPEAIQLLEDLVYHTSRAGRRDEAYTFYKQRLGGYLHVGWELGDHPKGARIVRLLEEDHFLGKDDARAGTERQAEIDSALYRKNYGLLDAAILQLRRLDDRGGQPAEASALTLQNISACQVLRGLLRDAVESARQAMEQADRTGDERLKTDCRVRVAAALANRGRPDEVGEAVRLFARLSDKTPTGGQSRDPAGLRHGWLLMRQDQYEEADAVLRQVEEIHAHGAITTRAAVLRAELACRRTDWDAAGPHLKRVYDWVYRSFDQEMLIAARLVDGCRLAGLGNPTGAAELLRLGLRDAEEYGYGIYWIELKLALARTTRDADTARRLARAALEGTRRKKGPVLYGAGLPECGYAWGEREARAILAAIGQEAGPTQH